MSVNIRTKYGRKSFTSGIKASHCAVVPGGFKANVDHFEKLLIDDGMKGSDIEALCETHGGTSTIQRVSVLRAELHHRGVLPIAGWQASATAAAGDNEVPAELAREISPVGRRIETLSAAVSPGADTTPAIPTVAALRAEIKTLAGKLDADSIERKMECIRTIREVEAGTFDAKKPGIIAKLRGELSRLSGTIDSASALRKGQICRQLKQLEA